MQDMHEHRPRRAAHRASAAQDGQAAPEHTDNGQGATDQAELAALREQLEAERQRAENNQAGWQRAAADFANYKRRTEQEREESARYANTSLVLNFLPAVDDLERALQHVDPAMADSPLVEGVRQILRKLQGALAAAGVSEIAAEGEAFDPNIHEAIAEAEGDEGKVLTAHQRGYRLGNRVIRPAMVVVGKGHTKTEA